MQTQIRLAYRCALLVAAFIWATDSFAASNEDDKQLAILAEGSKPGNLMLAVTPLDD